MGLRSCRERAESTWLGLLDNPAASAPHPHPACSGTGNSGQEGKIALCGLQNGRPLLSKLLPQVLFRAKAFHRIHGSKLYIFFQ